MEKKEVVFQSPTVGGETPAPRASMSEVVDAGLGNLADHAAALLLGPDVDLNNPKTVREKLTTKLDILHKELQSAETQEQVGKIAEQIQTLGSILVQAAKVPLTKFGQEILPILLDDAEKVIEKTGQTAMNAASTAMGPLASLARTAYNVADTTTKVAETASVLTSGVADTLAETTQEYKRLTQDLSPQVSLSTLTQTPTQGDFPQTTPVEAPKPPTGEDSTNEFVGGGKTRATVERQRDIGQVIDQIMNRTARSMERFRSHESSRRQRRRRRKSNHSEK